jgi:asparagine synthase (glutamine-hydrolysing)
MCGLAGIWLFDGKYVCADSVKLATRLLAHRGPDGENFLWANTEAGSWQIDDPGESKINLALGFRRLSILDLSFAGMQPMSYENGQYWIVFNGEIYNHIELRNELSSKGFIFRSNTDTEVILAAYAAWGEGCLSRFNGMWAFAIWDAVQHKLFCARDRFGIKPFYYSWSDGTFAFASEIKALLQLVEHSRVENPELIYDFLVNGWTDHTRETFFIGVNQLPSGHYLLLKDGQLTINRYWKLDPDFRVELPTEQAYAEYFLDLFTDALRVHLRSDVPVGTCLSGGLDSSSIVHLANQLLLNEHALPADLVGERQKTFSACFDDLKYDERHYIEQVLFATGAEANYVFPNSSQLVDVLPRIAWHQDEPFGSTSLFAQWSVMERVSECGVKVLLDGQGADELLAGYHHYFNYFWGALLQRGEFNSLFQEINAYRKKYPISLWYILLGIGKNFFPPGFVRWGRHFRREGVNLGPVSLSTDFVNKYSERTYHPTNWRGDLFEDNLYDSLTSTSLPALLRYEDRNSMAHSVEARVPFLDYRLVEFIAGLPIEMKIKNATTKVVLRKAMKGILPEEVRQRRDKMGFVTPEKTWFKAELGKILEELINSPTFSQRGYLDVKSIKLMLDEHKAGKRDITYIGSRWLSLELWFQKFIDPASHPSA